LKYEEEDGDDDDDSDDDYGYVSFTLNEHSCLQSNASLWCL